VFEPRTAHQMISKGCDDKSQPFFIGKRRAQKRVSATLLSHSPDSVESQEQQFVLPETSLLTFLD
jgi:hypothetical protein